MLLTELSHLTGSAGDATATALLNCLIREICAPEQQVWPDGAHLVARLPRAGVVLRTGLARPGRPHLPPGAALRGATRGRVDPGLLGQAGEPGRGRTGTRDRLAQPRVPHPGGRQPHGLGRHPCRTRRTLRRPVHRLRTGPVAGHRFHPSPKSRQGHPATGSSTHPRPGLVSARTGWPSPRSSSLRKGSRTRSRPCRPTAPLPRQAGDCFPSIRGSSPARGQRRPTEGPSRRPPARPRPVRHGGDTDLLRPDGLPAGRGRLLQIQPGRTHHQLRAQERLVRADRGDSPQRATAAHLREVELDAPLRARLPQRHAPDRRLYEAWGDPARGHQIPPRHTA